MSESATPPTHQSPPTFERELIEGAEEILRRTNEAEEREAVIELHESKDDFEDGPWGLMPAAITFAILGVGIAAWAIWQFSGI